MTAEPAELSIGKLSISDVNGSVKLTKSQVEIVRFVARCYSGAASYNGLTGALWPGDAPESALRIIAVHMHRIRRRIEAAGMRPLIGNVWAVGFIALRKIETVDAVTNRIDITEDLLEDIANLLETHQNRRDAIDLLSRLPSVVE